MFITSLLNSVINLIILMHNNINNYIIMRMKQ